VRFWRCAPDDPPLSTQRDIEGWVMVVSSCILMFIVCLLFVLFVRKNDIPEVDQTSPMTYAEERKAAIYENLRDLQFEFRVGKLSEADYLLTKANLQKELATAVSSVIAASGGRCSSCGSKFSRSMKFCGKCGSALS
jgi:hypothetical protein